MRRLGVLLLAFTVVGVHHGPWLAAQVLAVAPSASVPIPLNNDETGPTSHIARGGREVQDAMSTLPIPRVRSENPFLAGLIADAVERSPTFRQLIDIIGRTDGIVYIVSRTCGRGVRSCLLLRVTVAGRYRILFIKVDPRKDGSELMATIGHELQHAVEVLSDASLTNDLAIYHFYDRFVRTDRGRFETEAAISAGLHVQAEVEAWAKARSRCIRPREGCGTSASQDATARQN
jgi:hypothetical protein